MQTINRDTVLYTKTGTTKTDGDFSFTHDALTNSTTKLLRILGVTENARDKTATRTALSC